MNPRTVKSILGAGILLLSFSIPVSLWAQTPSATLSGTVTDSSGSPVDHAKISVNNVFSGQTVETESDASGDYKVLNLAPGQYEVSVSAEGFTTSTTRIKLAAGAAQALPVTLAGSASNANVPSLSSLGFPASDVQGNAKEQAMLNKRSHMLQIHQKLGMITVASMVAALIASPGAKGKHGLPGSPSGRNLHAALGSTTAGLYIATAYFALAAPRVPGIKVRGPIRLHKALAWVHSTGMIMTVILGAMAYSQESKGERVHGIAKYHSTAAIVTAAALGTAVLAVSVKF